MGYRSMLTDIAATALAAARDFDGASADMAEYQWAALFDEARRKARRLDTTLRKNHVERLRGQVAMVDSALQRGLP